MVTPLAGVHDVEVDVPPAGEAALPPTARSLKSIAWARLRRDRVAMGGGIVVVIVALVAIFAPWLTDLYGQQPNDVHAELTDPSTQMPIGAWGGLTGDHWLGVQPVFGQDIFAKIIAGARTSMTVGVLATLLSLVIGVSIGVIAGYYRGLLDEVLSRIMDILLSFPSLLFSIAMLAVFTQVNDFAGLSGQSLRFGVIIFVLGFFSWPYVARLIRGQVIGLRELEFIEASRNLGASNWYVITREVSPHLVGPIIVYSTLAIPTNILGEAALSFLGVGLTPPVSSWGQMLSLAANTVQVDPAFLFWPGLALFITVMAFNLFGDGLRDALDPRSTR